MKLDLSLLHPIYQGYVKLVSEQMVLEALANHQECLDFYNSIPEEKEDYRYETEKWTPKEIIAHLIDSERYFNSTALELTGKSWPDLKLNHWIFDTAGNRSKASLIDELGQERKLSTEIYRTFDESEWEIQSEIFGKEITLLGLGFINKGHELHHINTIKERYLNQNG